MRERRLKSRMFKSEKYLAHVRTFPCLVCGTTTGVDAHHPRHSVSRVLSGMGMKRCGDDQAVPLCRTDHQICHTHGVEIQFWLDNGIDPNDWAEEHFKEWKKTSQSDSKPS